MKENVEIQLNLSVEEAQVILDALGNQPFYKVFQIISKIQQEAAAQINGQVTEG